MSSPSDPPSSDPSAAHKGGIRPMPFFVALGWTIGTTLILFVLASIVSVVDIVSSVACQAAAYLLGLFLILRVHAPDASVREFLAIRRTHAAFYPIAVLLGAAAEAPALAVYEFIERRYPEASTRESAFDMLTSAPMPKRILAGIMIIALGPILEEIFFRGALWKPLERKYADARSIVIGLTAVLFAAVHPERRALIHLALMGLLLGLLRRLSGSILPSTLVHGTFNAIAFYFLITMPADVRLKLPGWMLAVSLFAIAALLALAYLVSTRTEAAARAQELDQQ